jgi:protein TonB
MAVARHGLPDGPSPALTWTEPSPGARARAAAVGLVVALSAHIGVGLALARLDLSELFRRDRDVEIDVNEPPPPPPDVRPPPPPPPEPPAKPKVVMRHIAAPPPAAPPPPNQTPPKAAEAPPVFGVTMDSVVSGDGVGMAVPVGNTLMTKDRSRPKNDDAPKPYAAAPTARAFTPVPDIYVAKWPEKIRDVNSDDIYPPEARRLGFEGKVVMRVSIDENGDVVEVKIVTPAGHGFDEAAKKAVLRGVKFKPAETSDGKRVPVRIDYSFVFNLSQ